MTAFDDVLARVLAPKRFAPVATPRELFALMKETARRFEQPIDEVIWHACAVDRLGLAFTAGYSVAMRQLGERLGVTRAGHISLAATESGGAHPRAIQTRLEHVGDGWSLSGAKLWCTLALEASHLVVIASDGEANGRPLLKAVTVPTDRVGITLEQMPDTPFCPEVKHARIELANVRVEPAEIAAVDGFDDVLKPFRTIEDIHVQAALLSWLAGVAVHERFAPEIAERAVALLGSVRTLATLSPIASATHLALAGLGEASSALLAASEPDWSALASEVAVRYRRDLPLLSIASQVRRARLERARATPLGE